MFNASRIVLSLAAVAAVALPAAPAGAQPDTTPHPGTTWLCHPSMATDGCNLPLDTTDLATGEVSHNAPVPESARPIDCFYIYPTVSDQPTLTQDPVPQPQAQYITALQVARFSRLCRVFAPVYRQVTLPAMGLEVAGADLIQPGYHDIENAWDDYLAHDNHGRGVIIISHSQGTLMARKLIRDHVDQDPQQRSRLVGAFLMGGNVTVAKGQTIGGDFASIPLCTEPGEYGCVTAYSTAQHDPPVSFFGNADPSLMSQRFGLPDGPGYEVACTDPGLLSGDNSPQPITLLSTPYPSGTFSILMRSITFPGPYPHSDSTWTSTASRATGHCEEHNGYHFYKIDLTGPDQVNEIPMFESHLIDINLGYDRLVSIAHQQTDAWLAAH
ncbi:DUF3089 domain-containing protein [Nocardia sp. NPDC052278]|uniref:DUF3089 domain-containing protein n=1 Tax=unclassified Nocardia TaxID=2637762 RepID=UPI0036853711